MPGETLPMISPMPRIPELSRSPRKTPQPMLAGCALVWQPGHTAKPKLSQRKSLSSGAMTQQPVMRMFICDCCSASDGAAEAAEREANILLQKEPRNWLARAILGLARLRLGRNKDALSAIRDL